MTVSVFVKDGVHLAPFCFASIHVAATCRWKIELNLRQARVHGGRYVVSAGRWSPGRRRPSEEVTGAGCWEYGVVMASRWPLTAAVLHDVMHA